MEATPEEYVPNTSIILSTDEGGEKTGINSYEKRNFTNSHDQLFNTLTVNKVWKGETLDSYKNLRPESITFDLYCRYEIYKYEDILIKEEQQLKVANIPSGKTIDDYLQDGWSYKPPVLDTSKNGNGYSNGVYDGPLSGAVEIVGNGSTITGKYPDAANHEYTKTLKPNDKTNNNQWENAIVFENLPVYINTCGDDRWNGKAYAIEYYVKERNPEYTNNPYNYGVNISDTIKSYKKDTNDSNNSNITNLLNDTTTEAKTVTTANELKTRDIIVKKTWANDGDYAHTLHYDIDFTLSGRGANSFSYLDTQTLTAYVTENEKQKINPEKTVTFKNVPEYDMQGNVINYSVAEKVHNSTETHQYGYYISKYSMTQSDTVSENDYTICDEHNTVYEITPSGNEIISYYTIENTLPILRIMADKIWVDNNNQDGQRPTNLEFTLTGTTNSATVTNSVSQHSISGNRWIVDFGIQPKYDINNTEYHYAVTEEVKKEDDQENLITLKARDYVRYVGIEVTPENKKTDNYTIIQNDTDAGVAENEDHVFTAGISTITVNDTEYTVDTYYYHFKNVYEPKSDSLSVQKIWDNKIDNVEFNWAQPQQTEVELYCSYAKEGKNTPHTVSSDSDIMALLPKQIDNKDYPTVRTIITATATGLELFDHLPRYVNPTGTAVENGQAYPITYYVKEADVSGYSTVYSNSEN